MSLLTGALKPCNCVADALARGGFVVARDRTGLVHFAVPLVLGGHPLGALVAGRVFDQHAEQVTLEHLAKKFRLRPSKVWEKARSHGQIWLHLYAQGSWAEGDSWANTTNGSLVRSPASG